MPERHHVLDAPLAGGPVPDGMEQALFGLGCFWGAERIFWQRDGVFSTAVGYAAATRPTPPTRRCAAAAPATTRWCWWSSIPRSSRYEDLLALFWESHDPTQGMRQGNDVGTQYRSGIYAFDDAAAAARPSGPATRTSSS